MGNERLTFEDIAMVKAAVDRANDINNKVTNLLKSLHGVIERSDFGVGTVNVSNLLFSASNRNALWRWLIPNIRIWFYAGVHKGKISVSIECENKYRDILERAVKKVFDDLCKLNDEWENQYAGNEKWERLHVTMPLEALLTSDDQETMIREFTEQALDQLKSVKLIEAITEEKEKESE